MNSARLLSTAMLIGGAIAGALFLDARRRTPYSFAGKVAIITGGSRGLGLILARMLSAEGASVVLIARDEDELSRARADLQGRGARHVSTIAADVRVRNAIQAAIERAIAEHGGVDVLINCAGAITVGPSQHMQLRDYEDMLAVHFWGTLYATMAALPAMRQQGYGRIVNITSLGGKIPLPHLGPYSVSKAAATSLSESLRTELAIENITVTTVCPATLRTGAHANAIFKGRHRDEYAGFSLLASLPLVSTDARAAARAIIEGCRRRKAAVIIPGLFGMLPALDNLAPNLVASALEFVNRLEPSPTDAEGDRAREGWDCQSPLSPSLLTVLGDRATAENNGLRGHAPLAPVEGTPSERESITALAPEWEGKPDGAR